MSILRRPGRRERWLLLGLVAIVGVSLQMLGANPATAQSTELRALSVDAIDDPLDPWARDWVVAESIDVELTAQNVTYPMGGGSIPTAEVSALHSDGVLYVRMQWADETADDRGSQVDEYTDAVAVEFPSVAGSSVPAVCMGQADGGVNIWQWRATNENGLGDHADELFTDAQVDEYPSTDDLYFSAREVGNPVARSGAGSAENLVAEGFGTLAEAPAGQVKASGSHSDGKWTVVVARDMTPEGDQQVAFSTGDTVDTAFAIWDGAKKERNGLKSVSQFVQLNLTDEVVKFNEGLPAGVIIAAAVAGLTLILGVGLALNASPQRRAAAAGVGATPPVGSGQPTAADQPRDPSGSGDAQDASASGSAEGDEPTSPDDGGSEP